MKPILLLSNHTKSILSVPLVVHKLQWGELAAGTDPRAAMDPMHCPGAGLPGGLQAQDSHQEQPCTPFQALTSPSQAATCRDTESMENPSWDAAAGTTTCPAHSSTPQPVPTLEIQEFFPSIKPEALASLEYHRHTVLSALPAPPHRKAGAMLALGSGDAEQN